MAEIETSGFDETILALSAFEPDLRKRLLPELRDAAKTVTEGARSMAPSGETGKLRGGYRVRTKSRGTALVVQAVNLTAQGNILEFAGSASSGKTKQGQSLIRTLFSKYGEPGRFMWDTWDRVQGQVRAKIDRALMDLDDDLQKKIEGADS